MLIIFIYFLFFSYYGYLYYVLMICNISHRYTIYIIWSSKWYDDLILTCSYLWYTVIYTYSWYAMEFDFIHYYINIFLGALLGKSELLHLIEFLVQCKAVATCEHFCPAKA